MKPVNETPVPPPIPPASMDPGLVIDGTFDKVMGWGAIVAISAICVIGLTVLFL